MSCPKRKRLPPWGKAGWAGCTDPPPVGRLTPPPRYWGGGGFSCCLSENSAPPLQSWLKPRPLPASRLASSGLPPSSLQDPREKIDRDREYNGRVLLRGDLRESLQISELEGRRVRGEDLCRLSQSSRGGELPAGMDHLGPLLPLRLGLFRYGPLHLGRQVHLFDLDHRDLDPPGIGVLLQDLL